METVAIGLICTVVFGVVMTLAVFIRQLLLSRDKNLNDLALRRAILQESRELSRLREQMEKNVRFDAHYQVLGASKDSIQYIDQKIDNILSKKTELVQRYAQMTLKESSAIIDGDQSVERKHLCDALKEEIDRELKSYETELQQLQSQRASIWGAHHELLNTLMANEQARNVNLDKLYDGHSVMLEKIYLRHAQSADHFGEESLSAGSKSFSEMLKAPFQVLAHYFKLSGDTSLEQLEEEKQARQGVQDIENEINANQISKQKKLLPNSVSKTP